MLHRCHVATGQGPGYYRREGQPHIRVWNSVSLQTVAVLGMTNYNFFDCAQFYYLTMTNAKN